jgi:hypothetical protein
MNQYTVQGLLILLCSSGIIMMLIGLPLPSQAQSIFGIQIEKPIDTFPITMMGWILVITGFPIGAINIIIGRDMDEHH